MRKKILQLITVFILCMLFMPGCADAKTAEGTIKNYKTKLYLAPGQTLTLNIKGYYGEVNWRSKNRKVARISNKNTLTAIKAGKATVYAKIGKRKYECNVVVMELSKSAVFIKNGKSKSIKLKYGGNKVTWKSSDKAVATVTGGKIRAVGEGETVIKAKAHGKTYQCKVTVPSVIFSSTRLTAMPQDSVAAGTAAGILGTDNTLSTARIYTKYFVTTPVFESSNPLVAQVNENGEITALKSGIATITVKADGLTYDTQITVKDRPVDVFLNYLDIYSNFVKENSKYVERNESPTETFAEAQALVAKKSKVKVNCRAGITWAFTEMGITTGSKNKSHKIYAKNGTFAGRYTGDILVPTNVQNFLIRITEGEMIGMTVKQAVDAGLLLPGDICCFKGRTHTFTYSGKGYKFYDGGSICEMTGYGKIGLLLDYSTGKSKKYTFDSQDRLINEVLRWK